MASLQFRSTRGTPAARTRPEPPLSPGTGTARTRSRLDRFPMDRLLRCSQFRDRLSSKSKNQDNQVLCVCNFTPVPRDNYRVGVPAEGYYRELLNSDASIYGGSNVGNSGGLHT